MTNTFELRNELDTEFDKESDRGCAILTLCLLEEALSQVFAAFLPGGERHPRHFMPRGRLSVGIEHAHKLGLIGDANLATFKALLEIRNKFAHSILSDMSFTSDAIREKLLKLELPNLEAVPDVLEQLDSNPRQRFMMAVDNLFFTLSARNGDLADPLKMRSRKFMSPGSSRLVRNEGSRLNGFSLSGSIELEFPYECKCGNRPIRSGDRSRFRGYE